ncbi:hypothetical protein MPSEU_000111800 [Mayamaea pseudoterrestris]|nr:hypothetical protein MPSEU_000111800 [Mayamaea pseudoterrestris]
MSDSSKRNEKAKDEQELEKAVCPAEAFFGRAALKPVTPEQIEVVGAGVTEVNGTYVLTNDHEDKIAYYKNEVRKGQKVVCRVRLSSEWNNKILYEWTIEKCEDGVWKHHYYHKRPEEIPPQAGWKLYIDEYLEPPPILLYGEASRCDWRLDPTVTRSDWTIQITLLHGEETLAPERNYHIHFNIVTLGSRASTYFRRASASDAFAETSDKISRIALHPLAAEQLPVLLDFLYGQELRIGLDNAIILYYLATYFGCEEMFQEVNRFCSDHFNLRTCGRYYKHAMALDLFDLVKMIERFCIDNFQKLRADYKILKMGSLVFWSTIFAETSAEEEYKGWGSELLAVICESHDTELDASFFNATKNKFMVISGEAAPTLLKYDLRFSSEANLKDLSDLQEKCVIAMAEGMMDDAWYSPPKLPDGCPLIVVNRLLKEVHRCARKRKNRND